MTNNNSQKENEMFKKLFYSAIDTEVFIIAAALVVIGAVAICGAYWMATLAIAI